MDSAIKLRQLVAPLVGVNEADLSSSSQLTGRLKNSIGRATLDAILRREFGLQGTAVYQVKTFGELEHAVFGTASGDPTKAKIVRPDEVRLSENAAPASGIDIERVDQLPAVDDFWADDFYLAHFTKAEIAYCSRQECPREHFAARWCAKEALKKCDLRFLNRKFHELELVKDEGGAVRLATIQDDERIPLPHVVSIAHTADIAIAVVFWAPQEISNSKHAGKESEVSHELGRKSISVSTILALIALALSIWSLFR
jgi:phosphopantetheine--protein transferase-like protein